jgi:hypothetical protein
MKLRGSVDTVLTDVMFLALKSPLASRCTSALAVLALAAARDVPQPLPVEFATPAAG